MKNLVSSNIRELGINLSYFIVENGKVSHNKSSDDRFCEFINILESMLKARFQTL